jgi:hypothetical protein
MFGAESYGELAFSEFDHVVADPSAFEAFLALVTTKRCWLLELDVFSLATVSALSAAYADEAYGELAYAGDAAGVSGGVVTLRYSTHGYISQGADSPAYTWYDGRLTADEIRVERTSAGRDGVGGVTTIFAECALLNNDGQLDLLKKNYSIEGRPARILVGDPGAALSTFGKVFTGVVQNVTIGTDLLRFRLSDGSAKLQRRLNETAYLGTGGLEGGADLKGKRKPKLWGKGFNIPAPLVDSTNLVYQVNDGTIKSIDAVFDRGVALTPVAGAPAPGQFQANLANGTFTLGATPAGTVTCTAQGDASGAGYVSRTSDIVLRMLNIAGLNASEIEPSSFSRLNSDAPADVGMWIGLDPVTVGDAVDALLAGIGAFGGFARAGGFTVGVIKNALGEAPAASFTAEDILELERVPLPAPVDPVVWRALVGYQRNYTVQTDLAASVTAAQRVFAAQELRLSKVDDASVQSRHLLALELGPIEAFYANQADADAEALRLFSLWSMQPALYRMLTKLRALTREMGQVIQMSHPRYGLVQGASGRVIGQAVRGATVELLVLV